MCCHKWCNVLIFVLFLNLIYSLNYTPNLYHLANFQVFTSNTTKNTITVYHLNIWIGKISCVISALVYSFQNLIWIIILKEFIWKHLENEIQILWTQYLVVLVLKNSRLEISTLGKDFLRYGRKTYPISCYEISALGDLVRTPQDFLDNLPFMILNSSHQYLSNEGSNFF